MSGGETLARVIAGAGPAALAAVREGAGACAAARARHTWARVLEDVAGGVGRFLESEVALLEEEGALDEACARGAERALEHALGADETGTGRIAPALGTSASAEWRATLEGLEPRCREHAASALRERLARGRPALRAMVRARTKGWDLRRAARIVWDARARLQRARDEALERDVVWAPEAVVEGGLARVEALMRSKWVGGARIDKLAHWLAEALLAETGAGTVPAAVLEAPPRQWTAAVVRARAQALGLHAPRGSARAIARAAADWEGAAVAVPAMAVMSAVTMRRKLDSMALRTAALDVEARGPQGEARAHWEAIVRESASIHEELAAQMRAGALASVARWAGEAKAPEVLETLRATWPRGHALDGPRLVAATHAGAAGWEIRGTGAELEMVRCEGVPHRIGGRITGELHVFVEAGTRALRVVRAQAQGRRAKNGWRPPPGWPPAGWRDDALRAAAKRHGVAL